MHTKPYLSWIRDVHTLELFHVFKDLHNIKHDIKSGMVEGDIPYGFLCTIIYRRMDDTHYTDKENTTYIPSLILDKNTLIESKAV